MPVEKRELYNSPNGDRWFLARDPASGSVFIRHEANAPSGGRMTEIEIGEFLSRGERHPQHEALLRLIGTLLGDSPDHARGRQARSRDGRERSFRSSGGAGRVRR